MSSEEYTIFCRNLSDNVTESILYELFLQAGPVEDVRIPTSDGRSRNFGFIVYKHKCSVKYAIDLFRDTKLFGKAIALQNRILDAEREAEMRSRAMEWRNGEINSLRGGPPPNFSRMNDMNVLRGGPSVNSSRNDEIGSLRGGSSDFSRKDNMAPRGFSDNPYNRYSPKSESDFTSDSRFMNPYASSFMNSYQSQGSRGSSSNFDRYSNGRSSKDRNDRNNREDRDDLRHDRDNSRYGRRDRDYSKQDRDSSRRDHNYRPERDQDRSDTRQRFRRSRSRDRSPISYRPDRHRHR